MGCCPVSGTTKYEVIPREILELQNHQCRYELNDSSSITFYPSPHLKDEQHGNEVLPHELFTSSSRLHNVLSEIKCNNLVSCNDDDLMIIQQETKINPFIECAIRAWSNHYPMLIAPHHIWLLILQSVSLHLSSNNHLITSSSTPLLKRTASRSEKIKLSPLPSMLSNLASNKSYDYSTTGTVNNKEWIGKVKELLGIIEMDLIYDETTNDLMSASKFTNATYLDEVSCKLCAMNVVRNSYIYDESTECGFPYITLLGKKDDWFSLRDKTRSILDKKCEKKFAQRWGDALLPILDRFIAVYDGDIDAVFWNSMVKRGAMTASNGEVQWYSGWINCFFPIINDEENKWCEPYSFDIGYIQSGLHNDDKYGGIEINSFPIGLCHVDAIISNESSNPTDTVEAEHESPQSSPNATGSGAENDGTPSLNEAMSAHEESIKVVAGFIGYTQNQLNYQLSPNVGWFVVSSNEQNGQGVATTMGNGAGYEHEHRLTGISEDQWDEHDMMADGDEYDDDGKALINVNGKNDHTPLPLDSPRDGDSDEDDLDGFDGAEYGGKGKKKKKKKKKKEFMPVNVVNVDEDEVDDVAGRAPGII
eukprot:CAMPEP_0197025450 /NCGR_PEP_ID=MMETSP1384-20130603/5782_1 /TAXON_ID=29189 /ORGANISM="Ammonia sp." /LENGTH=589 /DNA_ID=CAMNT_0042453979 /DNA_START=36 /DNA_END=1805 /DNA_ORIENTATION=+